MTKRLRILGLWLCVSLPLVGCGSDKAATDAALLPAGETDAGTAKVDLEGKASALKRALKTWTAQEGVVGASVVIKTDDGQVWEGTSGFADTVTSTKSNVDYYYRIASITKHVMATAFMSLVEDGSLSLDDKLSEYSTHPNGENITLRMLLNHTSGIRDYQSSERFLADAKADLARRWLPNEVIQYAIDDGPVFEPGQGWHYSNTGYLLLGQVLEAVTEKTAHEVLRERVFKPAGMADSYLAPAEDVPAGGRLATGYSNVIEGITLDFSSVPDDAVETLGWTAGGVISTASDIAEFGLVMIAGQLVSEASAKEMRKIQKWPGTEEGATYGLGTNVIEHKGLVTLGHGGGMPGFRTRLMYVPELGLSIVILTNSEYGDMLEAAKVLLDAVVEPTP